MKIHTVEPGSFKLDGGAVFGVVPKSLWSKAYPADENNLCLFALRNLLIETGDKLVLIDTGIGKKQDENFLKHYYLDGHHSMKHALKAIGFKTSDITDVMLTHLHFDHVGGAVDSDKNGKLVPAFPKATYHVSRHQWDWAINPNPREKASYFSENFLPLKDFNVLHLIDREGEYFPGIEIRLFHGHTDGLLVPIIHYTDITFAYPGDLLALSAQVPSSWVCGYDTRPLTSFEEREKFFSEAAEKNYTLILQHDYYTECCKLMKTVKGIRVQSACKLSDLL